MSEQTPERTAVCAAQGKALVLELSLPLVDVAHAHAVFDDQFSHANAAALSFPEAHWRQLEGPFLAGEPYIVLTLGAKQIFDGCCDERIIREQGFRTHALKGEAERWKLHLTKRHSMQAN